MTRQANYQRTKHWKYLQHMASLHAEQAQLLMVGLHTHAGLDNYEANREQLIAHQKAAETYGRKARSYLV